MTSQIPNEHEQQDPDGSQEPWTRDRLVGSFLSFFEEHGHLRLEPGPLIPLDDESVLFNSAGMQPLKPYFLGEEEPPSRRLVSCQPCLRTVDIDQVGKTDSHLTSFEMLGNFSVGDYFKKEGIELSWQYVTEVLDLDPSRLWVSYFGGEGSLESDEETRLIWSRILPEERLVPLGRSDNFWTLGSGPSGPCSEIYYDRGSELGCGREKCRPGCDCDRFLEFWNLVFTQFDLQQTKEGERLEPLPQPNVDTGLGLERTLLILEGQSSVFDSEPLRLSLPEGPELSRRILSDHLRSLTWLLGEGLEPSNVGRGYVLRRLLRRAVLHGSRLGLESPFLDEFVDEVYRYWQERYPLERPYSLRREEERFRRTLERGLVLLERQLERGQLTPEEVFRLSETHGLPVEISLELLQERGLKIDRGEVDKLMEEHRRRSRG